MSTPPVPDGPDTELAEAITNLRRGTDVRLAALEEGRVSVGTGRFLATIVRAVLARPAAGRDLTAQDVGVALDGVTHLSRQIRDEVARELNGIARPAVARTDGQPPAHLEGQALVDALVAAGWTRTGGQAGRYARLKRDVPVSNTALVPLDTSASDYTELLDTARAEIGTVSAAPADDTAAPDADVAAHITSSLLDAPTTLCWKQVGPGRQCAQPLGEDLICPTHGQRTLPDQDGGA